jgi:hypothetical protein
MTKNEDVLLFQQGTVCGRNFNAKAASLICREMGYKGAKSWTAGLDWHIANKFISLVSEVLCGENDATFKECAYSVERQAPTSCSSIFLTCYWGEGINV